MERWILNPTEIDFTAGTSGPISTGAPVPYVVENAAYADGVLQFYASDGIVYDANGNWAGQYGSSEALLKELAIAPGPGSCNTWCMFWLETTASANLFLFYQEVIVSSNGTVSLGSSGQAGAGLAFGNTGGIAISHVVPGTQADRDVYFVSPHPEAIHQFRMTGLSVNFIQTFPVNTGGNNFICEADLSHDGKYLCWGNDNRVYFWEVGSGQSTPLALPDIGKVYGVEFAPDNQSIYICHGTLGLLLWDPFSGIPPTPLAESNTYNRTQLEMALDGRVYAVRNDGVLGLVQGLNVMQSPLNLTVNSDEPDAVGVEYFALPDQIDGEDYSHFTGVPLVNVTATTVNSTALSTDCNTPLSVFNCNPILYGASFDGMVSSYKLDIQAVTSSCAVITGTGFLNYSSGWQLGAPPSNLDLRTLSDGGGLNLGNSTGKFAVTLSVMNNCSAEGTGNVGYLQVNGPPTPAGIQLLINSSNSPPFNLVAPVQTLPGVNVGTNSAGFEINNSTGDISFYSVEIEQVDCQTGAFVRGILSETTFPLPSGVSGLNSVNLNTFNVPSIPDIQWGGGQSFFGWLNGQYSLNNCYRLTVTVGNACGSSSDFSFLRFNCICFDGPGGGGSALMAAGNTGTFAHEMGEDITVFPNPFSDEVSVNFYLPEDSPVTLQVFDASGKLVSTPVRDSFFAKGNQQLTFHAGNLSPGIYVLKLATASAAHSSQIVKVH